MAQRTQEVGTIVKTLEGNWLVTAAGRLRLLAGDAELDTWDGQRAVVVGERASDAMAVGRIYPMMTERELIESTSFVLQRHGAKAREHAERRVSLAVARNDFGDAENWRCICQKIDLHLARNPWAKI